MTTKFEPYAATSRYFSQHGLNIRPSNDSDFNPLVDMTVKMYRQINKNLFTKKEIENLSMIFYGAEEEEPGRRIFYVVENSKKLVGSGALVQDDPVDNPDVGYMVFVGLEQKYRGKGLGETLVKDLLRKCRRLNFDKVRLITRPEFEAALGLYKKLGFKRARKQDYKSSKIISLEKKLS